MILVILLVIYLCFSENHYRIITFGDTAIVFIHLNYHYNALCQSLFLTVSTKITKISQNREIWCF